jgi:lysosomal acid lipase/cholesteryl ester hydrolase
MRFASLVFLALVVPALSVPPPPTSDPEIDMDPAQIIRHWGYTAQEFDVKTSDNYTLKLYRIPYGKSGPSTPPGGAKRPVVFLQHGFDTSSADWLINLPTQSAGFVFADAGFDVWLGNFRGTKYGLKHDFWSPTTHFFWQFSLTDMALRDLPAMLQIVQEQAKYQTGDKFYFIGHSTGATAAFILFSQQPKLAKQITQFYAIAPLVQMQRVQGPLKFAAPFANFANVVSDFYGVDEFVPNKELRESWATYVCQDPETDLACKNVLLMISGLESRQINASRIPVINAHSPGGTSVKAAVHLAQLINSGQLQDYDYGNYKINQEHYAGNAKPPVFNLGTMEAPPTYLYAGGSDWIARPEDIFNLANTISRIKAKDPETISNFNHIEFLWGNRAARSVYQPIMQSMGHTF